MGSTGGEGRGGHGRFFRHDGTVRLAETSDALFRIGAEPHRALLERAASAWSDGARRGFDDLDRAFHRLEPDLHVPLEAWLETHLSEFIVFEG